MAPAPFTIFLCLTALCYHGAFAITTNDLYVHNLLSTLHNVSDLVREVHQDMSHKLDHIYTSKTSLVLAKKQLEAILLESLSLTDATIQNIRNQTETARRHLAEVEKHLENMQEFHDSIAKLKDVEFELLELTLKIEEEVDSQEKDRPSSIILQQEISKLAAELKKQQEREADRQLAYDVIEAIQIRQFQKAEDTMKRLTDDVKLTFIVRTVYNHQVVNFNLIMDFAKSLTNKTKTYFIIKAAREQIAENRHGEAVKSLEMKKIVDAISVDNVENTVKNATAVLKEELGTSVEDRAIEELNTVLKEKKYAAGGMVRELYRQIYVYNHAMFKNTILRAIDDAYLAFGPGRWLEFARDSAYIEQIIIITLNVWEMMHKHGEMDTEAVTDIGFTLRETTDQDNYVTVEQKLRNEFEKIKDELPVSIKSAVYGDKVCLRNVKYGEYLFAPSDDLKYDEDRRHVFTWRNGSRAYAGEWRVERTGNELYIRNLRYNEYLYAAHNFFIKFDHRRSVYLWARGGKVTNGVWLIKPEGDNCYLRVTEYDEYLIAGDEDKKWDNTRRRIFTHIGGKRSEDAVWRIETC